MMSQGSLHATNQEKNHLQDGNTVTCTIPGADSTRTVSCDEKERNHLQMKVIRLTCTIPGEPGATREIYHVIKEEKPSVNW